MLNVQMDVFDV